jgi:hypothetical protein
MDELTDDTLKTWADYLPLENEDNIAIGDMQLYNELWDILITVDEFIELCSAETKMKLLSWLILRNYVKV